MNEQYENASEHWPLYDTVCIGETMSARAPGWYETFADLGQAVEVPFFNVRNRSTAAAPYCNFDSSEQVVFGYEAHSFGLEFYGPPLSDLKPDAVLVGQEHAAQQNYLQMLGDLFKHAGVTLKVSQDEKLICNALGLPGGGGYSGFYNSANANLPANGQGFYQGLGNGAPVIGNRFPFAEPLRIPRNRNISASITFSSFAKEALKNMLGPGRVLVNPQYPDAQNATYESVSYPGVVMMRLSFFGRREVQQRNNLTF